MGKTGEVGEVSSRLRFGGAFFVPLSFFLLKEWYFSIFGPIGLGIFKSLCVKVC